MESESSGPSVKLPKNSSILRYIFRSAPSKAKYKQRQWYGCKVIKREILEFANRSYVLKGNNQSDRKEKLTKELEILKKLVKKKVRLKELEPFFRRIDELKLWDEESI